MNHMSLGEWKNYARDEIKEDKRSIYEEHLYTCDQCMELYVEALESVQDEIPTIGDPSNYTNEVMSYIISKKATRPIRKIGIKQRWYEEKVFHYVLATAITLLLMGTGVFSELTNVTTQFEQNRNQQHSSFTENVLNLTTTLLDQIEQTKEKERDSYE